MHISEIFNDLHSGLPQVGMDEAEHAPLSPEEIQARLARSALFLSEENRRAWTALLLQDWFAPIRAQAKKAKSIRQWLHAVERIAEGRADASDVKQAVFYRTAFRQAQNSVTKDDPFADQVAGSLLLLSRYLAARLRPQHNHFG